MATGSPFSPGVLRPSANTRMARMSDWPASVVRHASITLPSASAASDGAFWSPAKAMRVPPSTHPGAGEPSGRSRISPTSSVVPR